MFSQQSGRSRPVNATGWSSRYASPRTLADDVERWTADEPVTAYSEPFTRRARRWAKKHRTSLTTATAAALVAAILIGGFAWQQL
jgi:eukaryotic-like serine/threonine-protein kinase